MRVSRGPALAFTWALVKGVTAMVTPAAVTQRLAGVWYVLCYSSTLSLLCQCLTCINLCSGTH